MATIFHPLTQPAFSLDEALRAIDRGDAPAPRLQAAADALHAMGFQRVVATLRDASFNATMVVGAGEDSLRQLVDPLPGSVWRRRVSALERFRLKDLYLLPGHDTWVAREFFGVEPSAMSSDSGEWLASDLLVGMLRGIEGETIGIVKMAAPTNGRRPDEALQREISWLLQHTASRIVQDTLRGIAQRRAERLQRLQEAGAALARLLDEEEIIRELARQALRSTGADGALLGIPDLDENRLYTPYRIVRGTERPRGAMPLGDGIIAQVARSGRAYRVGDREADRVHQRADDVNVPSMDDIAADVGGAASVLAVPLLVGIRLVGVLAVHSTSREVFDAEDEEMLATMASQAAIAITNARRYAESERERRQIEALADVARAVGGSLRLGEVQRLILRHALSLLHAEGACIAIRQGDYMHIVAGVGAADVLAGVHLPVENSLIGRAVSTGELIVSNSFETDPDSSKAVRRLAHIKRSLIAPLVTARGTIGALAVINRDTAFTDEDARVLKRLSDQVAVAVVNARLFEEVELATREWKVAFDSIASGMVVVDDGGITRRCNAYAAEVAGAESITSLLGEPFGSTFFKGSEASAFDELLRQCLRESTAVRATLRDESRGRVFEVTAAPHPDGGAVITFDDVTEIRALAERHRRVLETTIDAIIITGTDRRVVYANPAAFSLFGRDDLIGIRTAELIPTDAAGELERAESAAFSGEQQHYELPVLRNDGDIRLVSISSAPLMDVGQVAGTVACLRDVTEQRADAVALARSEALYSRLVESATDAIFTVDPEGNLTSVNRSLLEWTGKTREQLIGQSVALLADPRDREAVMATLGAAFRGERQKLLVRYGGFDGKVRVGNVLAAPITEHNEVTGVLAIIRDVTEEEIARESNAQVERLASMGRVLGSLANELNNPLSSLLAVAELEASSPTLPSSDRQAIEQIRHEARRASQIVRHLLGGTREPARDRASVRINQVVRETLDLHGYSLREQHIPVRLELTVDDPAVHANRSQLQQVLLNLLKNAEEVLVGWSGRREIVIRTRMHDGHAQMTVADSGPGISSETLTRVFEPLFTTRSDAQLRGLGLAVADTVVREHGGRIEVVSDMNGATFTVLLPVISSMAPVAAVAASGAERSVLIVEDEATLRSAMQRFLSRQNFKVTAVGSGVDALAALDASEFDLILLDLRMYGMSGSDVYERIVAEWPGQAERVVFVTGDMHNPEVLDFIEATGRESLGKPFQLSELMEKITTVIAD